MDGQSETTTATKFLPPDTPPFLTIRECAALLGVSEKTIRRRVADGELKALRLSGGDKGDVRVARDAFDDFLRRMQIS